MVIKKKNVYKLLQKKLIRLKINPLSNNKFLKIAIWYEKKKSYKKIKGKLIEKVIFRKRFENVGKKKIKKWSKFLGFLEKANKFFQKFKPITFNHYNAPKLASQGNSFKKQYKKNLLTKKIFDYFYGGLKKKHLKNQMTKIHTSKQARNSNNLSIEFFESRLDSVLFRAKFCSTMKEAKQLIKHKHIKVNNQIEKNNSYILKQGDLVNVNSKSLNVVKTKVNKQFKERFDSVLWPITPNYLNVNYGTLEIIFGKISNFNFSTSFTFKNDNSVVVVSNYRH